MSIIKSFSVGDGDMFYIDHNSDNFSIIDCCMDDGNKEAITQEIKDKISKKGIIRFISTHPDEDHLQGLKYLDEQIGIVNFKDIILLRKIAPGISCLNVLTIKCMYMYLNQDIGAIRLFS